MTPATVEFIGMAAAVLTTACWVPQAVRTIRTRDTRGISLWAQLLLVSGIGLWLVYGLMIMSWPLIFANTITFGLVATILTLKLRYG
jgi:MtN3 and saliva related transmembrane protein